MNCKKSIALLALALGSATVCAAHAHTCSDLADTAAFSLDQYLDVSFHSGDDRKIRGKQALHARVFADDGKPGLKSIPVQTASDPLYPLQDFSVVGKWWNLLGELAANPGVVWSYRDHFTVSDKDGTKYEIDRKALEKYPDLQRRLMAARPKFDRIEIDAYGAHDLRKPHTAYDPRIKFIIDANDVIVPPERQDPYMVPMSPPKWEDRLRIGELSGADLVKAWAQLKGVRCPQVTIHNLRLPTDFLVEIAKEARRYQGIDENAERFRQFSTPGFKLPPADKPYGGPKRNLEPLVSPPKFAKVERDGKKLVLKEKRKGESESTGRVLFSTTEYSHANPIDKEGRYFLFQKTESVAHILNARGQKIAVAGITTFEQAWVTGEKQLYLMPEAPSGSNHVYRTQYFYQYSMAPGTMTLKEFEDFKIRDRDLQPCPYRPRSGGVTLSAPWSRYDFHRVRLIIVDEHLKPLSDSDKIVRGESYPVRAGTRVCQ